VAKVQSSNVQNGTVNPNAESADSPTWPNGSGRIAYKDHVVFRRKLPWERRWGYMYYAIANPENFSESFTSNYVKHAVVGLSHEVSQWTATASRTIDMELWCSLLVLQRVLETNKVKPSVLLDYRNFFESLMMPTRAGLPPPLVAMSWPGADLYFIGVCEELSVEYQRFTIDGAPMEFSLSLSLLEVPTALMTSQQVHKYGAGYKTINPGAVSRYPK
jgi:hypothetical protein